MQSRLPETAANFISIHWKRDGSIFFRCGTGWVDAPSETAAVGLLPAALQGIYIDELLAGAKQMDDLTRGF